MLATMNLEALQEEVRDQFDGKLRRVAHDMQGMVREEIGTVWRVGTLVCRSYRLSCYITCILCRGPTADTRTHWQSIDGLADKSQTLSDNLETLVRACTSSAAPSADGRGWDACAADLPGSGIRYLRTEPILDKIEPSCWLGSGCSTHGGIAANTSLPSPTCLQGLALEELSAEGTASSSLTNKSCAHITSPHRAHEIADGHLAEATGSPGENESAAWCRSCCSSSHVADEMETFPLLLRRRWLGHVSKSEQVAMAVSPCGCSAQDRQEGGSVVAPRTLFAQGFADSKQRGVGSVRLLSGKAETQAEEGAVFITNDDGECTPIVSDVPPCQEVQEAGNNRGTTWDRRTIGEMDSARAGHQALWVSAQRWARGPRPRYGWMAARSAAHEPRSGEAMTLESRLDVLEQVLGAAL